VSLSLYHLPSVTSTLVLVPACPAACPAMWVAIVATIASFKPVIGPMAYLLLGPYLAWVSYASALTLWIWRHNPRQVRPLLKPGCSEGGWVNGQGLTGV
jgi:hypothetical protein